MNADTITTTRIADLLAIIDIARDSITRIALKAEAGDISHADAAEDINEAVKLIQQANQ